MMRFLSVLAVLLCLGHSPQAQGLVDFPKDSLTLVAHGAAHVFKVEVARSPAQLSQGLMYRRSLAADAGMLFDFGESRPVSMWMKNTLIPLDMLFISQDGTVVHVAERTIPQSLQAVGPDQPVRAVLELNGGTCARLGIGTGTRLRHPLFGAGP